MNYYYSIDGSEVAGPYSDTELRQFFQTGSIPPTTQVCAEGQQTWQPLSSVFQAAAKKAAHPQPVRAAAASTQPKPATKPSVAEPERQRNPQTLTITISTTALIIVAAIGFFLWQRGAFAPRATVPEIFKTQLMKFLEEGAKTNALADQGVSYMQLQQQVANTKAAYDLISVTWPPTLAVGCRQKFERSLEGWDLTIKLWQDKIKDRDTPTEPNINGFARFMAYAPDKLVVETHDNFFIVADYRGKQHLPFDPNISVLLTVAGTTFNEGRTEILRALQ